MTDRVQANDADDETNNGASTSTPLSDRALAPRTRDVYARAARQFDDWRDGRPSTDALVADYLGGMFERGLAPVTAEIAVAALAKRAEREGVPSPVGTQAMLTLSASAARVPNAARARPWASCGSRRTAWRSWPKTPTRTRACAMRC